MKNIIYITILLLVVDVLANSLDNGKSKRVIRKRQIYREQVLPHAGGKIPDTTFTTDRLFLNRLQKEGIAIPDGIVLEQRNPQVHQYYNKASRQVFRVALTTDGRYTPVEGRYRYSGILPSVETTYLYPQIHNYPLRYPPKQPIIPRYRPIPFPNPAATDNLKHLATKAPNKVYLISYEYAPLSGNSLGTNVNLDNNLLGNEKLILPQDFITSHIINDFDGFFNGLNLRQIRSTDKKDSRVRVPGVK